MGKKLEGKKNSQSRLLLRAFYGSSPPPPPVHSRGIIHYSSSFISILEIMGTSVVTAPPVSLEPPRLNASGDVLRDILVYVSWIGQLAIHRE